jgi:hypothetical protein
MGPPVGCWQVLVSGFHHPPLFMQLCESLNELNPWSAHSVPVQLHGMPNMFAARSHEVWFVKSKHPFGLQHPSASGHHGSGLGVALPFDHPHNPPPNADWHALWFVLMKFQHPFLSQHPTLFQHQGFWLRLLGFQSQLASASQDTWFWSNDQQPCMSQQPTGSVQNGSVTVGLQMQSPPAAWQVVWFPSYCQQSVAVETVASIAKNAM